MNDVAAPSMQELLTRQRHDFQRAPATAAVRRDRLERAIQLLVDHGDAIADSLCADFGHRSRHETLFTDVAACIGPLKYASKHLTRWMKPERRKTSFPFNLAGAKARVEYQPLGVVGTISPWNFPVNLTFAPLAGILAAGNRCMIKPSEYTPATADLMAKMFSKAFDATEIAVVTGGAEVGAAFAALPFDHLVFTGAASVGRQVMRAAAENLVPVTLELGGKSPVIVGRSADVRKAAVSIMAGKLMNAGQICLAPDVVYVPRERLDEFVQASEQSVSRMFPTLLANDDYASVINRRHYDRLSGYVAEARDAGARVHEINPASEDFRQQPHHKIPPTLIVDPADGLRVMQDEIFGPVLAVKSIERVEDAVDDVNNRARPLALYYFGSDAAEERSVLDRTTSGGVTLNDVVMHISQEDLPFGGVGASGMGCYHGRDGFRRFSHAKAVFKQSRINLAELAGLRPPYGEKFLRNVRRQIAP